ncbi:hypothetical protein [Patulibacter sp. SYSU D01012]|uniref:hypothetical protein n=1 Tax=Patulibacter sp. SYSU D01012 TaxID=2817381 RepID=UPI001B30C98E|nr:hypothetical protein [Patulibacter sp. SYSU D01012]
MSEPTFSIWRFEAAAHPVAADRAEAVEALKCGSIVWVDVTSLNDPVDTGQRLKFLPGFEPAMVASLFNPAERPISHPYLMLLSWGKFEVSRPIPQFGSPALGISNVNILRGPGWLMTFRRPALEAGGGTSGSAVTIDELIVASERAWSQRSTTADDIATCWIHGLATSFAEASLTLSRHLSNWDLARWGEPSVELDPMVLRSLAFRIDTLTLQLRLFARPGVDTRLAWFEPTSERGKADAAGVARMLETSLQMLDGLRRDVRSVIDQDRLAREAQARGAETDRRERLQAWSGVVAAAFLGPTVIASLFDVFPKWFSGAEGRRTIALIVLSAVVTVLIGVGFWVSWSTRPKLKRRLGAAGAIGGACVTAAVVILVALPTDPSAVQPEVKATQALESTIEREGTQAYEELVELNDAFRRLSRIVRRMAAGQ